MKRTILAAIVSGLFLNYSEEPISSHEMRVHLREKRFITSPAPEKPSFPKLEDLLVSTPETASLPIEERVAEFCEELPWVLNPKPTDHSSATKPSRYQDQPLTKRGFLQLQSEEYLQSHRPTRNYGRKELIERLNTVAESLYLQYGTTLQVYDLSRESGGYIPPHKSHRQGLDADIGIYRHKDGKFENSYGHLKTLDQKTLQINWDFIKTLQKDRDIDYIFWSQRYIWSMRKFVQERYGTEEWRTYGKVLHHEPGHADHFHVRINKSDVNEGLVARN